MKKEEIINLINNPEITLNHSNLPEEHHNIITAGRQYKKFMEALGIDLKDPNSKDTPYRVAKMFVTERRSFKEEPPELTLFPNTKKYDEYVVVKNIPYYSCCSHHHVVFYGQAYIAYHPDKQVLGISKFARVVQHFAAKPQIQEEMTQEIIEYLWKNIEPKGLMVVVTGKHMCMVSRGAKAEGSVTTTSAIKGEDNGFDKKEALTLFRNDLKL